MAQLSRCCGQYSRRWIAGRQGSTYVWDFRNLKPSPADDILVNLNNHSSTIAEYGESRSPDAPQISYYTLEAGRYFYLSRNFVPHAPSSSADFSATQVSSQDPDTGWHTPHAPGIGDALLLEIPQPVHIDQVGVIPGCGTSEREWLSHARLKEIEVTVNGSYVSKSVLPDEFTFPWPESHKAYEWINLPRYPGDAKTIRLIIRSVYSGSADQVTCIGKVMLRQWLSSRPGVKSGVDGHELP